MFKKFGENPPAYAIVFSVIAMIIADNIIFYIEGKDNSFLSILVGAITGALVFFVGMSRANAEAYTEKIVENAKLKTEIQKLESITRAKGVEEPSVKEPHTSSFEGFRGSLSEFEKQILNHFQRHTGHELLNNLYTANPEKHPEHWLVKIFNEVVFEYQSNRSELSKASKIVRAGDFLIYRVVKHHPKKQDFHDHAIKGLNYLLTKYKGQEKKRIQDLLSTYVLGD